MSKALSENIRLRIEEAGGWISFADFMQQALYAPQLGYYESGEVFGKEGDFITGADVGPWLALGMADLVVWGWQRLGRPSQWTLLEQGGGGGRLLCDVLKILQVEGAVLPTRVIAVERSAHQRVRQADAYRGMGMEVLQFDCLREAPASENVLFFSNELPDAFPVRCFARRGGTMIERGVAVEDEGFIWQERKLHDAPALDDQLAGAWPDGYASEWNPHLEDWQTSVSGLMQRGLVFTVDYGYARSEYYRSQRIEGTLLAHLRHEAVTDVLGDPGSRDITAHVDFTALGRAGKTAGLLMSCWMAQGAWLAQSPSVQQRVQQAALAGDAESAKLLAAAKRMLLPQGMGELFKLCIQSKGIEPAVPEYLGSFNRLDALDPGDG